MSRVVQGGIGERGVSRVVQGDRRERGLSRVGGVIGLHLITRNVFCDPNVIYLTLSNTRLFYSLMKGNCCLLSYQRTSSSIIARFYHYRGALYQSSIYNVFKIFF